MQSEGMDDATALQIWKSKSLNSKPVEDYKISNKMNIITEILSMNKKTNKNQPVEEQKNKESNTLPQPKVAKITEEVFCIYLHNELNVFKYMRKGDKIQWKNKNYTFCQITKNFSSTIKFVIGVGEQICVGFSNQFIICRLNQIEVADEDGKKYKAVSDQLVEVVKKDVDKLKKVVFMKYDKKYLVVLSADKLYLFDADKEYALCKETKIYFWIAEEQKIYADSICVSLLVSSPSKLYMFGIKDEEKDRVNKKTEKKQTRKCEVLFLTIIKLQGKQLGDSVSARVSEIDHLFEKGIFGKSKVFQLEQEVFLLSLHEEIVVIKENFERYVVWDNIALAPSKSSQKKGQLVLANKIVMVYTQMGQIYAQNIIFVERNDYSKLDTPKIDSFKGNDSDQHILYDALVLQYQPNTFMKVLIYFKMVEVFDPSNPHAIGNKNEEGSGDKTKITVTILCIQQDDPVRKLEQLFKNRKPPNVIAEFVERFKIDDLTKSKCEWSVSDKTEKDIENLLLEIKNNQYIQEELTKILKSSPHDLKFLTMIENKQINRYKKMLITKLLKTDFTDQEQISRSYSESEIDYIKQIIQWLMESIMFKKKITYSKNFLQFKEYDFIEIGKLKAASLKQEIKLLSCKGFEKRLQYFMNSFKYMTLFNFDDIFSFLIEDKNQQEVEEFFTGGFSFILPNFVEDSQIFAEKQGKNSQIVAYDSKLNKGLNQNGCLLWVQNIDDPEEIAKIETVESFKRDVIQAIHKEKQNEFGIKKDEAVDKFIEILSIFIEEEWFEKNKSKQHSILTTTISQLKDKFHYLKKIGVFHIMIKIFYQKIKKGLYKENLIDQVLKAFASKNKIPLSFYANVSARRTVYDKLPLTMDVKQLPPLSEFLIYEETKYFQFLFTFYQDMLLKSIKDTYDSIEPGFFREKFKVYLNSSQIQLSAIIDFLDQFQINSFDDIRFDVFTSIKKILKISDQTNTESFVNKLMNKEILKANKNEESQLIDEAKVAFGFYFFNFFNIFNLEYSYKDLIEYTFVEEFEKNEFILTILQKYCRNDYDHKRDQSGLNEINTDDVKIQFEDLYGLEGLKEIFINQLSEFFGVMLCVIDTLSFPIEGEVLFDEIIRLLFEQKRYEDIATLIEEINLVDLQDQEINMCRHFNLIDEFKQRNNNDVSERMTRCLIRWIREKYLAINTVPNQYFQSESSNQTLQEQRSELLNLFLDTRNAMEVLDGFLKGQKFGRQKQFLNMLFEIEHFHFILLYYVIPKRYEHLSATDRDNLYIRSNFVDTDQDIQEKSSLLTQLSGFIFLMRLFNYTVSTRFDKIDADEINHDISTLEKIYEHFIYASSYKDLSSNNDRVGFIKFCMQFTTKLIEYNYFEYAVEVLMKCINTSECYFRDVFFHFFSSISVKDPNSIKNFIKEFIGTEAQNLMQKRYRSFLSEQVVMKFETDESRKKELTSIVFSAILDSHRIDQAFYFLVRNNNLSVTNAVSYCENRFDRKNVLGYATISIYIKCLRQHLCEQFYPSYSFFKQKHGMLINQFQRKDIIKDLNIAMSKLKQKLAFFQKQIQRISHLTVHQVLLEPSFLNFLKLSGGKQEDIKEQQDNKRKEILAEIRMDVPRLKILKEKMSPNLNELVQIYRQFMITHGLDPEIKLNEIEIREAHQRLEQMNKYISPDQLEKGAPKVNTEDILKKEKQDKQYEDRIRKTKEAHGDKYYELNKQMAQQLSEARKAKQKYEKFIVEEKKEDNEELQSLKNYENLKERQKKSLKSVQNSYKSQASEKVHKMLQQMRQAKSRVIHKNQDHSRYSGVSVSDSRSNYQVNVLSPTQNAGEPKNLFLPITMNNEDKSKSSRQQSLNIRDANDRPFSISGIGSQKSIGSTKPQSTLADLIKLFEQREPQCKKYVEKLQFVKNNLQVGVQLTKSIYQSVYNFEMFIKYLAFLIEMNPKYKQVLEEKALKIAQQSLGIQYKINLKQLFPIEFFTNVRNIPMKQYYKTAYDIIRGNLVKILKKPDINIHGLAILFRYGFGSQNTYYYLVYEDYIRVLITEYAENNYDEKKVFLLAEKLRTLYSNITPDNRENKFQHLLRELKNEGKRKALAKQILKIIERRSEMLTGENSSDIRSVVMKLI